MTTGLSSAEVLIGCTDINAALAFYEPLGFRVEEIMPAEAPREALITGYGVRLRLSPEGTAGSRLRLVTNGKADDLTAPDGTVLELRPEADLVMPPLKPRFEVVAAEGSWTVGRAGMRYRDLIPSRQGGRFVGSHIQIPDGGPVPDYVHHHRIRFQMIYCHRGWVNLVYQHQGQPFVLEPGDAVLQPPGIRHQVLESSAGLEVIELGCPAIHRTRADPSISLPDEILDPDHDFDGQRFVRHETAKVPWIGRGDGYEGQAFGFSAATDGLAEAWVLRPTGEPTALPANHDCELHFTFVLDGSVTLAVDGQTSRLNAGAAATVPAGAAVAYRDATHDTRLLRVELPG